MRRSRIRFLLHALRALLLLGALWAAFTVWVFEQRPEWVRALGQRAVAGHVGPWRQRLLAARQAGDVVALGRIADALAGYTEGDRLGQVRRDALDVLVDRLLRAGDRTAAARRSDELLALAPRDVMARIRHGRLLARTGDRAAEGLAGLSELHRLLPADPRVAVNLAEVLLQRGRTGEALDALVRRAAAVQPGEWRVEWGTSFLEQGFLTPSRRGDSLELRFELPPQARSVSLLPPPYSSLRLHDATLQAEAGDQTGSWSLAALGPRLAGAVLRGATVVLHGEVDGRIRVELPAELSPDAVVRCTFRASTSRGMPQAVLSFLEQPVVREALAGAESAAGDRGAALLRRARLLALAGQRLQVFWRAGAEPFAADRSRRVELDGRLEGPGDEERLVFVAALPVGADAGALRLDFPPAPGTAFRLTRLVVVAAGGPLALDAGGLEPLASHSLRQDGAEFVVTGPDPWFAFAVPAGDGGEVLALQVEGEAR